ncbi:MAG: cysteine desulfurase-like protein [Betaproteobacteria bacterium]
MRVDLSSCRKEFPSLELRVNGHVAAYFDGPGGTQVPTRVIEAVTRYYREANANSHGEFVTSHRTDEIIAAAREAVADMLGAASADEIAFGPNMTTLNFALSRAIGRALAPGDEIVITDLDHEANRSPWQALEEKGVVVRSVRVNVPECTLDYDDLERATSERTKVVALGYASNAVGTINDVRRASALAHSVGALCVVDAVHYAPHGVIDVRDIGCDFLLCSAYKFFGPHIGILYGRRDAFERLATYKVRPQNPAPPYKIETGTLNHEGMAGVIEALEFIAGLGDAVERIEGDDDGTKAARCPQSHPGRANERRSRIIAGLRAIELHERPLFCRLMDGLANIRGVTIYGLPAQAERTPTVSFTMEGGRPLDIARFLGQRGIFVWHGDFYATTLIERLGLADSGGVVRIGMAPYNTVEEVERLLEAVEEYARH